MIGGRMSYRLGDEVDDYCSRCRMLTNNSVEAMIGEDVVKVRCRTCNFSHAFRQGQVPEKAAPKKTSKKTAFDAVLASVTGRTDTNAEAENPGGKAAQRAGKKHPGHHQLHTLSASRRKSNS